METRLRPIHQSDRCFPFKRRVGIRNGEAHGRPLRASPHHLDSRARDHGRRLDGAVIARERPIEAVGGTVEAQDDGTVLVLLRDRRYLIGPSQPLAGERVDMYLKAPVFWVDDALYGRSG